MDKAGDNLASVCVEDKQRKEIDPVSRDTECGATKGECFSEGKASLEEESIKEENAEESCNYLPNNKRFNLPQVVSAADVQKLVSSLWSYDLKSDGAVEADEPERITRFQKYALMCRFYICHAPPYVFLILYIFYFVVFYLFKTHILKFCSKAHSLENVTERTKRSSC